MATKKIIWKQKTGESTSDILYPQTSADQVVYTGSKTVKDVLDNIGTDLESKYVTLDTYQDITDWKKFVHSYDDAEGEADDCVEVAIKSGALSLATEPRPTRGVEIRYKNAELGDKTVAFLADRMRVYSKDSGDHDIYYPFTSEDDRYSTPYTKLATLDDIPQLSLQESGSGNAITGLSVSRHTITITKGNVATSTATESADGLMSKEDKKNLNAMWSVWTADGTSDTLVNKVQEVLKVFENFPESDNLFEILSGKADASDLSNFVTLNTAQVITGRKTFSTTATLANSAYITINPSADTLPTMMPSASIMIQTGNINTGRSVSYQLDGIAVVLKDSSTAYKFLFPSKSGTFALKEDLPTSMSPTGAAGGDLTGTYPNPTIGSKKVTTAKIADGAVTATQLGANAVITAKILDKNVTTAKLADAAVTDAKLSTTGVTAGNYSVVSVNAQGRVTAGSQLFTIGTSDVIPSTVTTGAFYLREITAA